MLASYGLLLKSVTGARIDSLRVQVQPSAAVEIPVTLRLPRPVEAVRPGPTGDGL
jgi:hypothetical protein